MGEGVGVTKKEIRRTKHLLDPSPNGQSPLPPSDWATSGGLRDKYARKYFIPSLSWACAPGGGLKVPHTTGSEQTKKVF